MHAMPAHYILVENEQTQSVLSLEEGEKSKGSFWSVAKFNELRAPWRKFPMYQLAVE